jgi:hypothetical protein
MRNPALSLPFTFDQKEEKAEAIERTSDFVRVLSLCPPGRARLASRTSTPTAFFSWVSGF